ncbi:glycine betaine/L-proline ABC transporter ATP-binding protein [Oscillospiraceae bacterium]|nr:glycine betaine/L-proline ABC transporter ATP-binding protein [Oscillospiraceae bacterium]
MSEKNQNTIIEVEHVSKLYGLNRQEAVRMMESGGEKTEVHKKTGVTVALWDINLRIPKGKIFVIIGLSGSGKSTLVRCFNRLNRPSAGHVRFEGRDLAEFNKQELLEFRRTKISMVFQSFGLMSHRDVLGNVSYGLEVRGMSREERERRAMEVIHMVGLDGWEKQNCGSLSGGMRQRVGIARALANDPEVLLMDEPFSALDPLVRRDMQFELLQIQRKLGKTVIFITHDIDEAFKLGDMVAIMRDGKIVQVDTPEEMSAHPADEYVQAFINSADKAKVLTARNIMITPDALVRESDGAERAIRVMSRNALSTAYVVDDELRLRGILTIRDALKARQEGLTIAGMIQTDVPTTGPDTLVADIMPIAAEAPYPIGVVDDDGQLMGIVTKANVLSSLI